MNPGKGRKPDPGMRKAMLRASDIVLAIIFLLFVAAWLASC